MDKIRFDKQKSTTIIAICLLVVCLVWLAANSFLFETSKERLFVFCIVLVLTAVAVYLLRGKGGHKVSKLNTVIADTLYHSKAVAVTNINLSGSIVSMNETAYRMLGYSSADELVGMQIEQLTEAGSLDALNEALTLLKQGRVVTCALLMMHQSSFPMNIEVTFEPVLLNSKLVGGILISSDLSDHKRSLERIKYMAYYDDLTGLPNRALFHLRLDEELVRAGEEQTLIGVVYIDLENFKLVNATFGREFADMALLGIAERLNRLTSQYDFVARMEGDEFAIILVGHQAIEDIVSISHEIYSELMKAYEIKSDILHIQVNMGIAINLEPSDDSYAIFKKADMALLRVKETEGEHYLLYSSEWIGNSYDRLNLQHEIHRALRNSEFELYYQPQYDLLAGKLIGMEALIRWNHPTRGLLTPNHFIPIAEQSHLIIEIGEWVIQEACRQNRRWFDSGYPIVPVSVNLSLRQLVKNEMVKQIEMILHETNLPAKYLDIEITETMSYDTNDIKLKLKAISELGVGISVDDFGTGYSSFHYLKSFPITRLKIDRSFVLDILKEKNNEEIVSAIIAMAHKLDLQVIAEGVETEEQLELLKSIQCDEMQGYLKSPPVPSGQFVKFF